MTPTAAPLTELAIATLGRLSDLGVQQCVLFTGHFADEQLALIDTVAADWNAAGARPRVLPLAVNRSDAPLPADHAGTFETSLLHALAPDLVQLHQLPSLTELPIDPPGQHGGWNHRHNPGHPLRGIMGPDPRAADLRQSQQLLDQIVDWVCRQVTGHEPTGPP
jgi:creatinine amidohydrolase